MLNWAAQSAYFVFQCISAVMTSCHQMPANSSFSLPSSVRPNRPATPLDSHQPLFRQSHTSCHSSLYFCSLNKLIFKLCFVKGVHNLKCVTFTSIHQFLSFFFKLDFSKTWRLEFLSLAFHCLNNHFCFL